MTSRTRRVLSCAAFVLFTTCSLAVDYGRTQGAFNVSTSGAATYSIPIWTPPGPNGITPSISVNYNSQGGNGLAGVGWSLSAVSSIERCNRTKHHDGNGGAIELTSNDRYCIGGNNNGDGLADLVWTVGGSVMLQLNTSTSGASVPSFGTAFTAASFSVGQGNVAIIDA
jgi:hypothetical protein